MMKKVVFQLPRPMPASNDCLPHAAMNLGANRGVGLIPQPGMVSRLVIEPQMGAWIFHRLDKQGGFVGDSWHDTKEDALWQAKREFGVSPV
jgi:hypothetical protein